MSFYYTFIKLCNEKGKSPSRVAENIGLSRTSPNGWKKGKFPTDANLQKLAEYFGVTVDYLLGKEETKKEPAKLDRFQSDYYSLDQEDRETVDALIKSLLSKAKYKKIDVG